jgi:hypothetical protein
MQISDCCFGATAAIVTGTGLIIGLDPGTATRATMLGGPPTAGGHQKLSGMLQFDAGIR